MKTTAELREDYLRQTQNAAGVNTTETVKQLEALMPEINGVHEWAIKQEAKSAFVTTPIDLTAQAQAELESLGYKVEPLEYSRSAENPLLYHISWNY